jgi:hypothetical protein
MFEPQNHPNDFQYPGGPPVPPYDAAGWTLAYQMGILFDRIMDGVEGPFTRIPDGTIQPLKGKTIASAGKAGFYLSAANNHSFTAVNALLKEGATVYRIEQQLPGVPAGSFFVPAKGASATWLLNNASALGADLYAAETTPRSMKKITPSRVALWDTYGGSMASGWMRWIMDEYQFKADLVYAQDIDKGNLHEKYDLIIFVGGAIPAPRAETASARMGSSGPKAEDIPAEYRKQLGNISSEKSIPALKTFLENGGRIITMGTSTNLAYHLGVPVRNALTEMINGTERNLPAEKFYIPGSLLRMRIDTASPAAWGMQTHADVLFDRSPVFSIAPDAQTNGKVRPIAWFDSDQVLRSGWAWGQAYLNNGVAAFAAQVGKGTLYGFGPEITFRAQSHGTFKFVFNQMYQ